MHSSALILLLGTSYCCTATVREQIINPKNASEDYNIALEAIFSIGLRLQALLDPSWGGNFVVSPLSTTAILGQLMLGAEGEFRDHLYEILSLPRTESNSSINHYGRENVTYRIPYGRFHLQLSSLLKYLKRRKAGDRFVLNLDNALFYNQNIQLRTDFQKKLSTYYDTELRPLDFSKDTTSIINNWVTTHTKGLITSIVGSQLSPATASIFLNSIYFKAEWEHKFSDELNSVDKFYTNGDHWVEATFMLSYIESIPFVQAKGYRVMCLPYLKRELGMYIILPDVDNEFKYDIRKFISNLSTQEIIDSLLKMKPHDVVVKIPKLSLSNTLRILEPLQRFEEIKRNQVKPTASPADALEVIKNRIDVFRNYTPPHQRDLMLSAAAKDVNLKVSDIVQHMVFSLNENGTEAAAVTAGIIDYIGGSKSMVLNRPFSFFIRHEDTLATIFWGAVTNPSHS